MCFEYKLMLCFLLSELTLYVQTLAEKVYFIATIRMCCIKTK